MRIGPSRRWSRCAGALVLGLLAVSPLGAHGATRARGALPPGLRGLEVTTLPTNRRVVALTFDAGGDAAGFSDLIRTLSREHVRTTFFLTGRWVRDHPRFAVTVGRMFPVGNHTYNHPSLIHLDSAAVRSEIVSAEQRIRAGTGRAAKPLFRFPYGDSDARTIAIANRLGYACIRWTVDTLGWETGQTADGVVTRVLDGLRPGAIILMHVGSPGGAPTDTRALPQLIHAVRARGYRFVELRPYLPL